MPMKDMIDLGGFDERFADGHGFDDTDFAARVVKKKMDVKLIDKPFCLHQFHTSVLEHIPDFRIKEAKNKKLYDTFLTLPDYKVRNRFMPIKENL